MRVQAEESRLPAFRACVLNVITSKGILGERKLVDQGFTTILWREQYQSTEFTWFHATVIQIPSGYDKLAKM